MGRLLLNRSGKPGVVRARRRWSRLSQEDRTLRKRHKAKVEGVHGESEACHGLARAVRRGLENMKIQAYLTAAAVNLKRLALIARTLVLFRFIPKYCHNQKLS